MTEQPSRQQIDRDRHRRSTAVTERLELLEHLQTILEPFMVVLGLIFLTLLLLDYSGIFTDRREGLWLSRSLTGIWGIFLIDFVARFLIAPRKLDFLKANWLSALSLALPFLRPFRALRAVRAVRSISLVRLLGGVNRGMRVLRRVAGGHQIAYLVGLTLFVTLTSAVGVWYFERDVGDASIRSFSDALWWSSAMVTTINNEKYVVSVEGRVLAILLRVYAVSVFGFITATIATYLLGRNAPASHEDREHVEHLHHEIADLRRELARVTDSIRVEPTLRVPNDQVERP